MRFMRIVLLLPLVFPTVLASATVSREIADTVPQLTGGTRPVGRLMIASAGATAYLAGASAAGQDAQAVEAGLGSSAVAARPAVVPPAPPAPSVNCDEWNTREFFETATAESLMATIEHPFSMQHGTMTTRRWSPP